MQLKELDLKVPRPPGGPLVYHFHAGFMRVFHSSFSRGLAERPPGLTTPLVIAKRCAAAAVAAGARLIIQKYGDVTVLEVCF